jgi:septum formation protein
MVDYRRFILQPLDGKNQRRIVLELPDMHPQGSSLQLYLASNSPRRRDLLALIGFEFMRLPVQVDETPLCNEDGKEYVIRIASNKAHSATAILDVCGLIIAADTAVIGEGGEGASEIFGKPRDENEAASMLRRLRGRIHQVITAIQILSTQDALGRLDVCTTDVPMRDYSDAEINTYIASGDPMDKAGAYAIQHAGFHPVENLQGCYANVMGLPLCHLTRNLIQSGIPPRVNVPRTCQSALGYNCPVYLGILNQS